VRPAPLALAALAALAVPAASAQQEVAVDVELVLAVDISGSVDSVEAEQQRQGYVAALADPAVVRAIRSTFTGRVAMAYVEWAGAEMQEVVVPWTVLEDEASAAAFAAAIAEAPTRRAMWTSISGAIDFAVPLFDDNGFAGERRVIDVSGDGVNNRGRSVTQARDEAVARGIVINGLPILNDRPQPMGMPTPMEVALDRYYAESVIGGPGSFIVPALGFGEFKDAILQKLILEIAGTTPPGRLAEDGGDPGGPTRVR
jgi:Protein of unknown function (DUF1194)